MKRLIRAEQIQNSEDIGVGGMIELDKLSEADIRHDRCISCGFSPLDKKNGFKFCPSCQAVYKILNGIAYIIKSNQEVDVIKHATKSNKTINVVEENISETDLKDLVGQVKESCMSVDEISNFKNNGGKTYDDFLKQQEPIMVSMLWESILGHCQDINTVGLLEADITKTMKGYLSRYNYQKETNKEEFNSI